MDSNTTKTRKSAKGGMQKEKEDTVSKAGGERGPRKRRRDRSGAAAKDGTLADDNQDTQAKNKEDKQVEQFREVKKQLEPFEKLLKDKTEQNPFVKTLEKAKEAKENRAVLDETNMKSDGPLNKGDDLELDAFQVDPAEALIKKGHLPLTSDQYLENVADHVDTSALLEVVQVFHHKQNRQSGSNSLSSATQGDPLTSGYAQSNIQGSNDYALIVLKINSVELQQFYGKGMSKEDRRNGQAGDQEPLYLVQIWKNKQRLFQHVHYFPIKTIYLNKTELAYILDMPADSGSTIKPFDNHLKFIYLIQPFTEMFTRIKYPFEDDSTTLTTSIGASASKDKKSQSLRNTRERVQQESSNPVLFINDEYIVIAEKQNLKYAQTSEFFRNTQGAQHNGLGNAASHPQRQINSMGRQNKEKPDSHIIKYFQELTINTTDDYPTTKQSSRAKIGEQLRTPAHQDTAASQSAQILSPTALKREINLTKNNSVYDDQHAYEQGHVQMVEFKVCSGLGYSWNILSIEQSFRQSSLGCNSILVYAGHAKEVLTIQIFKLCVENQNASRQNQEYESNPDLVPIGQELGHHTKGDTYTSIQILNISEKQVMTILQTKDGHVDITDDLLAQNEKKYVRFTDILHKDQKLEGKITEIIFGSEKLHVKMKEGATSGLKGSQLKSSKQSMRNQDEEAQYRTFQFSLNFQTQDINHWARQQHKSLITSILDEEFFKQHIQIYSDMKLLNGLLVLALGPILCLYRIFGRQWYFYFNREDPQRSNKYSKLIAMYNDPNQQKIKKLERQLKTDSGNSAKQIQKKEGLMTADKKTSLKDAEGRESDGEDDVFYRSEKDGLYQGIREHCYFHENPHEIEQNKFFPIKSHNVYEILLNLIGGAIRRVTVIYRKQKESTILNKKKQGFDSKSSSNLFLEKRPIVATTPQELQETIDGLKAACRIPTLASRNLLTRNKTFNINKFNQQTKKQICTQINYSMFRQYGIFDQKVYLMTIHDHNQNEYFYPELFTNNENNMMTKIAQFETHVLHNYRLIEVQNAKKEHLFFYDRSEKKLNVYNIGTLDGGDESQIWNMDYMNNENLIISITKFDYDPHAKYFIDNEILQYVWNGDLFLINLFTGKKEKMCFSKEILQGQYLILPDKQMYFKSRANHLMFTDLKWIRDTASYDAQQDMKFRKIMNNQSSLYSHIEYDVINNEIATFTSTNIISVIPNLSTYERDCKGTFNFEKRFLASNLNNLLMNNRKLMIDEQMDNISKSEVCQYLCPTEYTSQLCALDGSQNLIYTWRIDSGKMTNKFQMKQSNRKFDFRDYQRHNEWNGSTLLQYAPQPEKDPVTGKDKPLPPHNRKHWIKIRIEETGPQVQREFYHDAKLESKLYVSSTNDILLEFLQAEELIRMYQITNHNTTLLATERADEIKKVNGCDNPYYFSHDFRMFLKFESNQGLTWHKVADEANPKLAEEHEVEQSHNSQPPREERVTIKIYETNVAQGHDPKEQYLGRHPYERDDFHLPSYESILKNDQGLPYIFFSAKDRITFLTTDNILQTIPLASQESILAEKSEIDEIFINEENIGIVKGLLCPNASLSQYSYITLQHKHAIKSLGTQKLQKNLNKILDIKRGGDGSMLMSQAIIQAKGQNLIQRIPMYEVTKFAMNNVRCTQTFSHNSWAIMDMIVQGKIHIDDIHPSKLSELMRVILPNGEQLLSLIVKHTKFQELQILIDSVNQSRQGTKVFKEIIPFDIISDLRGTTPLHECVSNTYTKAAEDIIVVLAKNQLNNHIEIIDDILPKLVEICPTAMNIYFYDRLIKCPWALQQTEGNLKTAHEEVNFAVFSSNLGIIDTKAIKNQIFEKDPHMDSNDSKRHPKRLPMQIMVFDIPKLHHFNNPIGQQLIETLSQADDISIFDRRYIQAILEYQFPPVKSAIIWKLFLPYAAKLCVFSYYSITIFENELSNADALYYRIAPAVCKSIIVVLSLYQICVEWLQFKNAASKLSYLSDWWNYIDILPIVLVVSSLAFSTINISGYDRDPDMLHVERYLNALASFFLWIKLFYFFRIFRNCSYFINTIIEVLVDMKVFLLIFFMSIFAFSGTFYILAQNNEGEDVFVHSYFESLSKVFEISLGQLGTDQMGQEGYGFVYFIFTVASLFLVVIMLNLLIAIISDTFAKVQNVAQAKSYQQFADLISDNSHIVSQKVKQKYDSQGNYLFIGMIEQGTRRLQQRDLEEFLMQSTNINGVTKFDPNYDQQKSTNESVQMSNSQFEQIQQMISKQILELKQDINQKLKERGE